MVKNLDRFKHKALTQSLSDTELTTLILIVNGLSFRHVVKLAIKLT